MPRENSFSDSEGRSLTPDLEDDIYARDDDLDVPPISPTYSRGQHVPSAAAGVPQLSVNVIEPHSTPRATMFLSPSKTSVRSPRPAPTSQPTRRPVDKFRATVRKVMAMHRTGSTFIGRRAGAEPGIDPRRASADLQFGGLRQDCVIEVSDYSSVRSSFGKMTNKEFINYLDDPGASEREPWVKVRWINIAGMSWDVLKAVAIKYDLHPLALEDVFHSRRQTRSKADYYSKHLFLHVLCHELADPDEILTTSSAAEGSTLTGGPRSDSPLGMDEDKEGYELRQNGQTGEFGEDEATVFGSGVNSRRSTKLWRRKPLLPNSRRDLERKQSSSSSLGNPLNLVSKLTDPVSYNKQRRLEEEAALEVLKKGERINVRVTSMYIFLLRDGTVISIHKTPTGRTDFTEPIGTRLSHRDTGLRKTADPSLLVESLIDLIVDRALEVIDAYHLKIEMFERQILLRAKMSVVRDLHILSGDLILHKRTLEPIKTLVYGLRRYDLDRVAALQEQHEGPVIGFMSHRSKIYLADVHDHMEYILTSLDMFANIGENLISYAFNMTSYEMNEVMRKLTLVTLICMPLTILTGYFGMNFDPMWSVQENSDAFFWKIAAPVMAVLIPTFLIADIKRAAHYMRKQMLVKQATKTVKPA